MQRLALAAALALPGLIATAPTPADACAMRRVERPEAPKENPSALMAKARKAEQAGEERTAIRLYEQAMHGKASASQRAQAAYAAARLHAKAGASDRAMSRLNRALSLDPNHSPARLAYAEGLVAESPAEAREQLARLNPKQLKETHERRRYHLARARTAPAGADVQLDLAAAARHGADAATLEALRAARAEPTTVAVHL